MGNPIATLSRPSWAEASPQPRHCSYARYACGFACAGGESEASSGANATAFFLAASLIAHLIIRDNQFAWSGHNAGGDPAHRHALIVDVGRDFLITSEGNLDLTGPGRMQGD